MHSLVHGILPLMLAFNIFLLVTLFGFHAYTVWSVDALNTGLGVTIMNSSTKIIKYI